MSWCVTLIVNIKLGIIMNSKEITSLAFKLLALYVLVTILSQIGQFSVFFRDFFQYDSTWYYFLPIITIGVLIGLFALLWSLSNKIIASPHSKKEVEESLKVDQAFILSLVGFYLLPQGIYELTNIIISEYFVESNLINYANSGVKQLVYLNIIASLLKILISLSLIFKTKGWVSIFKKLKYMGR